MSWTYQYDEDKDETTIRHNSKDIGVIDGQINSWRGGMPIEAKSVVKDAVDDSMVVDLLYGFEEIHEDEEPE